MNLGRQFGILLLASALLSGLGCEKKKPQLPAQAKAPVETVSSPLPNEISETVPPPPPPAPNPTPAAQPTTSTPPPKHRPKKKVTPPAPSTVAASTPPTTTAPSNNNGSSTTGTTAGTSGNTNATVAAVHPPPNPAAETPPDPAIAADVSSAQLTRQKQSTAQLLDETEKSISGLKGQNSNEDEMLAQIRSYVTQSRKATSDGDFERAYNLATKAHLLSDALVKK